MYVVNERQTVNNWTLEILLYEVRFPNVLFGIPAMVFVLVGGLGLSVMFLQRQLGRWIEAELSRNEREKQE